MTNDRNPLRRDLLQIAAAASALAEASIYLSEFALEVAVHELAETAYVAHHSLKERVGLVGNIRSLSGRAVRS